ncbi:rhomboid domain-containing protein [Pycnococcus provasolii]
MECASEALAARRHGAGHEHAEHAIAIARVTGFALALGLVIPGLDNAGHVGGMTSGALCGWVGAKNSAT